MLLTAKDGDPHAEGAPGLHKVDDEVEPVVVQPPNLPAEVLVFQPSHALERPRVRRVPAAAEVSSPAGIVLRAEVAVHALEHDFAAVQRAHDPTVKADLLMPRNPTSDLCIGANGTNPNKNSFL